MSTTILQFNVRSPLQMRLVNSLTPPLVLPGPDILLVLILPLAVMSVKPKLPDCMVLGSQDPSPRHDPRLFCCYFFQMHAGSFRGAETLVVTDLECSLVARSGSSCQRPALPSSVAELLRAGIAPLHLRAWRRHHVRHVSHQKTAPRMPRTPTLRGIPSVCVRHRRCVRLTILKVPRIRWVGGHR
jgi:hypothetical protein